uniref:UPAR/Ly6 domain-containing protein n=1 Tax=Panagrellus redivivus TaxID=6233 RepID=A0A7E4UWU4_PANRE
MVRPTLLVCLLFVCSISGEFSMTCKPYYRLPSLTHDSQTKYCDANVQCTCANGYIHGNAFQATDCKNTLDTTLTNYFDQQWNIKLDLPSVCKKSGCYNSSELSISCISGVTRCPSFDCGGNGTASTTVISGFLLFLSYVLLH